jgi:hypothetical protein
MSPNAPFLYPFFAMGRCAHSRSKLFGHATDDRDLGIGLIDHPDMDRPRRPAQSLAPSCLPVDLDPLRRPSACVEAPFCSLLELERMY